MLPPHKPHPFLQKNPPKPGAKYLIIRNLKGLVEIALRDIQQFTNTSLSKLKALEQLKYIILFSQSQISPHLQPILKVLAKTLHGDIQHSEKVVLQVAQLIGEMVPVSTTIPLILNLLHSQQLKQNSKLSTNLLTLLSRILTNKSPETLQPFHVDLFSLIAAYTVNFKQNDQGITSLLDVAEQLLNGVTQITNNNETTILFTLLLEIQATRTIREEVRGKSLREMEKLAKKCGYTSISELHGSQIGPVLDGYVKEKGYNKWSKTSKERFKFDTIVRNCHQAISKFMPQILEIIQYCIGHQNDLQVRIDTLVLIEHILTIKQLKEQLQAFSVQIMKNILIPSIQWKVGKPQIKIRKAGVINIIHMMRQGIVTSQGMLSCFKQLLPPLKNCLTDDWAPQLRLASCELIQQFLQLTQQDISDQDLRDLYPSLIQRLDDSQDPIRKKATQAINIFFHCPSLKKAQTIFEYVLQAVFIHFDDHNQEIQDAVELCLKHAATFDSKKVLAQAMGAVKKMRNTQKCQELIQYCLEMGEEEPQ